MKTCYSFDIGHDNLVNYIDNLGKFSLKGENNANKEYNFSFKFLFVKKYINKVPF